MDAVNQRKIDHIRVIQEESETDRLKQYFDGIHLIHRALPEVALDEVDPSTTFLGKRLSFPLLISCMTGGDHDVVLSANRNLALAAEKTGVALGVGSQRVMFTSPQSRASFALREHAPSTLLFSNMGAVQLNYGLTEEMCGDAIETVGADALYLHLNPLQEAIQPGGDTNFTGLAGKIGSLAGALDVPVIIKEVGAGISPQDAELLIAQNIRYIDVAGTGGTSWSRIESHRQSEQDAKTSGRLFQDWGIPTPLALQGLAPYRDRITLIASGGIRNGIDMAKAMVLGGSLCGIARPFLEPAMQSVDAVVETIEGLKQQFTMALFLMGLSSTKDLVGNHGLLLS